MEGRTLRQHWPDIFSSLIPNWDKASAKETVLHRLYEYIKRGFHATQRTRRTQDNERNATDATTAIIFAFCPLCL